MHEILRLRLPRAVEIALLLGIAVEAWQLGSALRAPAPPEDGAMSRTSARGEVHPSLLAVADEIAMAHLFGPAAQAGPPVVDRNGAKSGYKLHGVFSTPLIDWQFAILVAPDGRSGLFHPGQTLADGSVLNEIGTDYAMLSRGGRREKLSLALATGAAGRTDASIAAGSGAAPTGIGADTKASLAVIGLSTVAGTDGVGLSGAGPPNWRDAGLRPTDVIVAIDGLRVAAVLNTQAGIDRAVQAAVTTLTVERGGRTLQIEAQPSNSVPPRRRRRV